MKRLFYGVTDLALTERGRAQARELGEKLAGDTYRALPGEPALARGRRRRGWPSPGGTCRIVSPADGLMEQDMGGFENKGYARLLAEFPEQVRRHARGLVAGPAAGRGEL